MLERTRTVTVLQRRETSSHASPDTLHWGSSGGHTYSVSCPSRVIDSPVGHVRLWSPWGRLVRRHRPRGTGRLGSANSTGMAIAAQLRIFRQLSNVNRDRFPAILPHVQGAHLYRGAGVSRIALRPNHAAIAGVARRLIPRLCVTAGHRHQ
jgi:hypothetical protein